jgi:acyl carrier protein
MPDMTADPMLLQQLMTLLQDKLQLEVKSEDTDIIETGLLDSLLFVQLILQLEEAFGMQVSLEDLEIDQFRSVRRLADLVASAGAAAAHGAR